MRPFAFLAAICLSAGIYAQRDSLTVTYSDGVSTKVEMDADFGASLKGLPQGPVQSLVFSVDEGKHKPIEFLLGATPLGTIDTLKLSVTIKPPNNGSDLRKSVLTVREGGGAIGKVTVPGEKPEKRDKPTGTCQPEPISTILKKISPELRSTQYGLAMPSGSIYTNYGGRKYVHLFFDHRGQPLFCKPPAKYVL